MKRKANKTNMLATASSFLLFAFITTTFAQTTKKSPKPIRLISGDYFPQIIPPHQAIPASTAIFAERYFKLIQFNEIPSKIQRTSWADGGLHLVDYLPDDTYFAVIDQNFDLTKLTDVVITIINVGALFKVEAALAHLQGEKPSQLVVSYYNMLDGNAVIVNLEAQGIVVENHRASARQLDIRINPTQFETLTSLPYLQFIGAAPAKGIAEEANEEPILPES
ncbi:MAG: hypothetical protein AAF614_36360 [Chloroflexota bacterium]